MLCSMTVFVSSLPYETTTTDLITHFSFIGPVKNGFVVKDKVGPLSFAASSLVLTALTAQESQESKGVGYVTFTSKVDAEKAVADLNGGQFGADAKRKIRVELANDKVCPAHPSHFLFVNHCSLPDSHSYREDAQQMPISPRFPDKLRNPQRQHHERNPSNRDANSPPHLARHPPPPAAAAATNPPSEPSSSPVSPPPSTETHSGRKSARCPGSGLKRGSSTPWIWVTSSSARSRRRWVIPRTSCLRVMIRRRKRRTSYIRISTRERC